MGGLSIWHITILLLFCVLEIIPMWKVLNKAGFTGWWSLLSIIPFVNILVFWVFAFIKWPALSPRA